MAELDVLLGMSGNGKEGKPAGEREQGFRSRHGFPPDNAGATWVGLSRHSLDSTRLHVKVPVPSFPVERDGNEASIPVLCHAAEVVGEPACSATRGAECLAT